MYLEYDLTHEAKLRMLRFFCYTLTADDFIFGIEQEKQIINDRYGQLIAEVTKQAEKKIRDIEKRYNALAFKARRNWTFALIGGFLTYVSYTQHWSSTPIFLYLSLAIVSSPHF